MRARAKILVSLALCGGVACTKAPLSQIKQQFTQPPSTASVSLDFCTSKPNPAPVKNDYIFIVDMSGSNARNCLPDNSGTGNCDLSTGGPVIVPGTNPAGVMDFGAIKNFLTNLQGADPNDPNNTYTLIEFSTNATTKQPFLTNNYTNFFTLIQNESTAGPNGSPNFGGWTDYLGALSQLQSLVQGVIQTEAQNVANLNTTYAHNEVIIFTTDGAPIVPDAGGNPTLENEQAIVNEIGAIEQLAQNNPAAILSLQFNVVYYYVTVPPNDASYQPLYAPGYSSYSTVAVQFLTNMSKAGDGRLFNVVSGSTPDYTAFIVPPLNEPLNFAGLYVHDMNMTWVGTNLTQASDGMMADSLRLSLGAPPGVVYSGGSDSDGNGISDYVEYLTTGKICNDPTCLSFNATNYAAQTKCQPFYVQNSNPIQFTHRYVPKGIFNDCELILLGANIDGTGLISGTTVPQDFAAVFNYPISLSSPTNWLGSSPFNDGYSAQDRIKLNIDPFVSFAQLQNYQPYNYQIRSTGSKGNQSCYSATVSPITVSKLPSDTIEVYLVQTSPDSALPTVRVGKKTITTSGSATVSFQDGDLN